jgi:hypothetical protein
VGGTISGLSASGLVLRNNGGDDLTVSSGATTFTFATAVAHGQAYAATVLTQPTGYTCTISSGSGTMSAAVTSISISCAVNIPVTSRGSTTVTTNGNDDPFVAISSDGNTLALGYPMENTSQGGVHIFTRSGYTWTEQAVLVGSGAGANNQGQAVKLSSNGNTCVFGSGDYAWAFTRSGSTWSEETKFTSTYATDGSTAFGATLALSPDGNTAAIGALTYNSNDGAVQIWTRSGTTWTKIQTLPTVLTGSAFGSNVALSGDGTTLAVGAGAHSSSAGGVFIYVLSSGTWTAQGSRLLGTGGGTEQGGVARFDGMALSTDGNTLAFTGHTAANSGGFYVFTRSGTSWSQEQGGTRGTPAAADPLQTHLGLSGDGNLLVLSGEESRGSGNAGAMYIFTRSGTTWTQSGSRYVSPVDAPPNRFFAYHIAVTPDASTLIAVDRKTFWTYTP